MSAKVKTTFTPSKMRTTFTPAPTKFANSDAFLADPARPRSEKIVLLKKLLKGDVHAQRIALKYLSKPEWIYHLKRRDSALVRKVEKIRDTKITQDQYVDSIEGHEVIVLENQRRAQLIWKQIKAEILTTRMRMYIGSRCDFFDSRLNKLDKRGVERLYRSVTSFRPPRECRR